MNNIEVNVSKVTEEHFITDDFKTSRKVNVEIVIGNGTGNPKSANTYHLFQDDDLDAASSLVKAAVYEIVSRISEEQK